MSRIPPLRRPGRIIGLFSALLAVIAVMATPATAQPATGSGKVEAQLATMFDVKSVADFFVEFAEQADLSGAAAIEDWNQRGEAVVAALQRTANQSQSDVRKHLDAQQADYQPYWISNTILVRGGSEELAQTLASFGNVTNIRLPHTFMLPTPSEDATQQMINAVEWGIDRIRADDVWADFGVRGEGIVVANIDTGVDFDHPALVNQYRGNTGGGTFNHNYNWHDPSRVCGNPSLVPCDNNNHGTHTMGTMVGWDGGANQIGVAPGARWIAAKGCESSSCSESALLSSGQWVVAPTDLAGANPRPDLRPHIVNNSWGGGGNNTWYRNTVNAWRAAGIFPAFSNGNSGPSCGTSGSPGDYAESYSSGAFDINNAIASFSSRGPATLGGLKPNLAAPGVSVRSSINGGGYGSFSGTSMASPHTAGTVALMWSAAATLVGDIGQTSTLLDDTATDTPSTQCGGTDDDNNVWGEGKLNAYIAVEQSPRGPVGTLNGTVTNASNGAPIAGAQVQITGPVNRTSTTGANGTYQFTLPTGTYAITVSAFGFGSASATATVTEGQTTTQDFALTPAPSGSISGTVSSASGPVANAVVTITGTPIPPATTDANGNYSFASVPHGTYTVTVTAGGCFGSTSRSITVDGAETENFTLPQRGDSFGYTCVIEGAGYVEGDTPLALVGDDASTSVNLPFSFFFYGSTYNRAFVTTNGNINFLAANSSFSNVAIPSTSTPNAAIYALWDDLNVVSGTGSMWTKTTGTAPNRSFLIEWRNVNFFATSLQVDVQMQLNEDGSIVTRYRNIGTDPREQGNSATVGIENRTGTVALQYSFNTAVLSDAQSIRYVPPPSATIAGTVTDANDGLPVEGATVQVSSGSTVVGTTTTATDGTYNIRLLLGTYTVDVSKTNYVTDTGTVTLSNNNEVVTHNATLATSRAEVAPDSLWFLANAGQLRTTQLTLSNTSTSGVDLTYTVADDSTWMWVVPGSGTVTPGDDQALTVRVDPVGLAPGVYRGTITVTTNAGRIPVLDVPVSLVVPAYRQGVNSGGSYVVDTAGDPWGTDQAYSAGSFGYIGAGAVVSVKKNIAGTDDDALYQNQREATSGYRFDNLPAGTYVVDLNFAELRAGVPAGRRVFDVSINGNVVLPGYDPVAAVGSLTADHRIFTVTVADGGSIIVSFAARAGYLPPIINGVRVTHRPDM